MSYREARSRLGLYRSREVLERRFAERHGEPLAAAKAKEIIAHLEQGQQYFDSAESAGVLAGPLELYYGILALARALVLYLDPTTREASLTKLHGLTADLPNDGRLENIQLTVTRGTFDEFLDATGNAEQISVAVPFVGSVESPKERIIRQLPRPQLGATFSFVDLLSRIPGLRHHLEEAFGTTGHCFMGAASFFMATLSVSLYRDRAELPSHEQLSARLRVDPRGTWERTEFGAQFSVQLREGDSVSTLLPNAVDSLVDGEHTIVEPFPAGWGLSELASYVAAAHVLSMLVRYYPTRWASLFWHEGEDRLLPVIERLRELLQTDFVQLLLWELERPPATAVAVPARL